MKWAGMSKELKAIVIKSTKGWTSLRLGDLWRYRGLFYFLAWRDIKVRYKQTVLGVAWAVINPLLYMAVWTLIFGRIAKLPSAGVPYALITLTGTLIWSYFSEIVNGAGGSIIQNTNLVTKVYFPRLIIPLSVALRALLDFLIAFAVFMALMLYYRIVPTLNLIYFPLFLIIATVTAVGIGLWVAALSVKYRDVAKILPHFIQIAFFLTPVAYLSSAIPQRYQWISYINPIAGAIDGFRWALLRMPVGWGQIAVQASIAVLICLSGMFYFRNFEKTFADII